ncbi:MAG: hypothetical protein AB3N14_03025 [Flavobacteriaceae bacterium]
MKNSTLLFRSLAVIIFIAGSAHLVTYASQNKKVSKIIINKASSDSQAILGNWKVTYNDEEFKGSVLYEIVEEDSHFVAYTIAYQDENGYSKKAERTKSLIIESFDGYEAKGDYSISYEGEKYHIECDIEMVSEGTFRLSYDYYGESAVEIWIKQ